MVPGRTHVSLVVAWALDHDPTAAVMAAAKTIPEDQSIEVHLCDPVTGGEPSSSGQSTPQQRLSPGVNAAPDTIRKRREESQQLAVEQSSKSTSALQANAGRAHRHRSVLRADNGPV